MDTVTGIFDFGITQLTILQMVKVFITGAAITAVMTPVAIWLAPKIGAVDIPKDGRRMHTKPMPRFGGMAMFIGITVSLFIYLPISQRVSGVIVGGILIFIVGIIDDLKNMPAKVKFICQIGCATVLYMFNIRILHISNPFDQSHLIFFHPAVSFLVTVIWVVGVTNTINLIDGLDGLAAGVSAISAVAIAYVAYIHGVYGVTIAMLAVAGGAAGFLPYNFNPAQIFFGDGGSLFLGFMLASLSIISPFKSATFVAIIVPVFVLAVPIFDTLFAILRRAINKRPIMEADKGHLHHRIVAAGFGQRRAVLTIYAISGVMGVAAITLSRQLKVETVLLVFIAVTLIYVFLTDSHSVDLVHAAKGKNNIQEDKDK